MVKEGGTDCQGRGKGLGDFPGGPVVKNPPTNVGDRGSIPGLGTMIPHAVEKLSLYATSTEPACRGHMLCNKGSHCKEKPTRCREWSLALQLGKSRHSNEDPAQPKINQ